MPDDFKLPVGLIVLDISESEFIGNSFTSFFLSICSQKAKIPFILNASKLKITEYELQLFKQAMDMIRSHNKLSVIQSNIQEVNLSQTFLPSIGIEEIFLFLRTQTELRQLTVNDIDCDNPETFTFSLIGLIPFTKRLSGIDFTLRLGKDLMVRIVSELAGLDLERICIRNCNAGNEGLQHLARLVQTLQHRKEFAGDGCNPTPSGDSVHPLFQLWETVAQSKTIKANDFPHKDIASLDMTLDTVPDKHTGWVKTLQQRPLPRTQAQRIEEELKRVLQQEREEMMAETSENT